MGKVIGADTGFGQCAAGEFGDLRSMAVARHMHLLHSASLGSDDSSRSHVSTRFDGQDDRI